MTILAEDRATKDWFAAQRSDVSVTTGALAIVHGSGAGGIVELDAPVVNLLNLSEGEDEGIATYSFDLEINPSSGDDEFTITTK